MVFDPGKVERSAGGISITLTVVQNSLVHLLKPSVTSTITEFSMWSKYTHNPDKILEDALARLEAQKKQPDYPIQIRRWVGLDNGDTVLAVWQEAPRSFAVVHRGEVTYYRTSRSAVSAGRRKARALGGTGLFLKEEK